MSNNQKNEFENVEMLPKHEQEEIFTDSVPNFIRLFVVRRVLRLANVSPASQIQNFGTFSDDAKTNKIVPNIISRLIEHGIDKYMKKWYML